MSQEMYDDWLDAKLVELSEEYYKDSGGDPDVYYEMDGKFREYCQKRFEDYCAGASDWAYEQWKDRQEES